MVAAPRSARIANIDCIDSKMTIVPRRVCVVTGSRAEYGMLVPLMRAIARDDSLELRIAVTGAHLSPRYGETWKQIAADGFRINARIDLELGDDTNRDTADALGRCISKFAAALEFLQPEIVVILGDRYEILGVASACLLMRVPVMHLHGGEITRGALDESIRHAITKLSAIHGVATPLFGDRIRQMGEIPERVFVVGTLSLDAIRDTSLIDRDALSRNLGINLEDQVFVVTYHPETAKMAGDALDVANLLEALESFPDHQVIFTLPNADPGNGSIRQAILDWSESRENAHTVENLGSQRYWSLLEIADLVIGNSSSGLIEAPYFGVPTLNIGDRQLGRPRAPSVIDCDAKSDAIVSGIKKAMSSEFSAIAEKRESPYGGPGATDKIVAILKSIALDDIMKKGFQDA